MMTTRQAMRLLLMLQKAQKKLGVSLPDEESSVIEAPPKKDRD